MVFFLPGNYGSKGSADVSGCQNVCPGSNTLLWLLFEEHKKTDADDPNKMQVTRDENKLTHCAKPHKKDTDYQENGADYPPPTKSADYRVTQAYPQVGLLRDQFCP